MLLNDDDVLKDDDELLELIDVDEDEKLLLDNDDTDLDDAELVDTSERDDRLETEDCDRELGDCDDGELILEIEERLECDE